MATHCHQYINQFCTQCWANENPVLHFEPTNFQFECSFNWSLGLSAVYLEPCCSSSFDIYIRQYKCWQDGLKINPEFGAILRALRNLHRWAKDGDFNSFFVSLLLQGNLGIRIIAVDASGSKIHDYRFHNPTYPTLYGKQTWINTIISSGTSRIALSYQVYCKRYYYGPSCTAGCTPGANYICDGSGNKICQNGYVGMTWGVSCWNPDKLCHVSCQCFHMLPANAS